MSVDLRWRRGQEYTPKQGPHTGHRLQVIRVKPVDEARDRVSVSCLTCQGYFHFVDHWGRWSS